MTLSEQLIVHIRETATPDKARILRMRELARALASASRDPAAAAALVRRLNGAFLVLQLATLSEDDGASAQYRGECLGLVQAIQACGAAAPQPVAPPPPTVKVELAPATPQVRAGWGRGRSGGREWPPKTFAILLIEGLGGIYGAERKLAKALPRLARSVRSDALRAALLTHQAETELQIERLHQVFAIVGRRAQERDCPAIDGLIVEAKAILAGFADSPALDAGLLAAARAVEHYEISRYGALKDWAGALGLAEAAALLGRSLDEESRTESLLAGLASKLAAPAATVAE